MIRRNSLIAGVALAAVLGAAAFANNYINPNNNDRSPGTVLELGTGTGNAPGMINGPVTPTNALPTINGHTGLRAVTPADGTDLPNGVAKALWVGGTGTIAIIADQDTASVTLSAVPAGTLLQIRAKRVLATGTSATLIVAIY